MRKPVRAALGVWLWCAGCAGHADPRPLEVARASAAPTDVEITSRTAPATPPPPAVTVPSSEPRAPLADVAQAPPPGATEADAVIVWVADPAAALGIRSVWLASSSKEPGGVAWIAASREEPVVAAGSRLLAVRGEVESVPVCACAQCTTARCTKLAKEASEVERPFAVDLATGAKRGLLAPIGPSGCGVPAATVDSSFAVRSAVGSIVQIAENQSVQACEAAHPMWFDVLQAVDVATAADVTLSPSPAQIGSMVATATQQLMTGESGCVSDETSVADYWGAALVWGAGGRLQAEYTFTVPAPYMCGTGPGHYTVATTIVSDDLPSVRPVAPAMAAWVAIALGTDAPLGLSPIEPGVDRAKLLERFRRAPLPVPDRRR